MTPGYLMYNLKYIKYIIKLFYLDYFVFVLSSDLKKQTKLEYVK